nr:TetR family transcriptional regulator C-terminal domain-containing protein [uncultured Gellertiella sp.]
MDKTLKPKMPDSLPRKASRDARRQQLIESTIITIGRCGYAKTTLTEVATTAGLSHGLINFHFNTKDQLLTDTLLFLAQEYRENWVKSVEEAPDDTAEKLAAMVRADFNEVVCTPDRLAAWCAFWGEAQGRPVYQEMCGSNDIEYAETLERFCTGLAEDGGYAVNARDAARVIRILLEGIWLDLITMTNPYSNEDAMRTAFTAVAALFPKHFTASGPIARVSVA